MKSAQCKSLHVAGHVYYNPETPTGCIRLSYGAMESNAVVDDVNNNARASPSILSPPPLYRYVYN
jgi:hypothetical protein